MEPARVHYTCTGGCYDAIRKIDNNTKWPERVKGKEQEISDLVLEALSIHRRSKLNSQNEGICLFSCLIGSLLVTLTNDLLWFSTPIIPTTTACLMDRCTRRHIEEDAEIDPRIQFLVNECLQRNNSKSVPISDVVNYVVNQWDLFDGYTCAFHRKNPKQD